MGIFPPEVKPFTVKSVVVNSEVSPGLPPITVFVAEG